MSEHAILRNGDVIPVNDIMEWAAWFGKTDRRVAFTETGGAEVSTVFLGLNHAFRPTDPPMWFETLVFGGTLDQEMERYTTLEEARLGHERMVARVQQAAAGRAEE